MSNTVAPFADSRTVSLVSLKQLVQSKKSADKTENSGLTYLFGPVRTTMIHDEANFQGRMLHKRRSHEIFQDKPTFIFNDRQEFPRVSNSLSSDFMIHGRSIDYGP